MYHIKNQTMNQIMNHIKNQTMNQVINHIKNQTMNKLKKKKESEEEFIEDLKEPFSLNNESTTNWYDKNKFNKILTTIDNSSFNNKNKIGKFKFNDINNLSVLLKIIQLVKQLLKRK